MRAMSARAARRATGTRAAGGAATRRMAWRALRAAGLLAVLAALATTVDVSAAFARLLTADPVWLALAALLLTGNTVLTAARWRLTAAALGHRFGLRWAVGEYYLAQAVNQGLPGGVLGDAGRAIRAGRGAGGVLQAAQAVLLERVSGQAVLFVLTALAVGWAVVWPGGLDLPRQAGLVAAGVACAAAALPGVLWFGGRGAGRAAAAARAARAALFARDVWARQLGLSLAAALCLLFAFAACAHATGAGLPLAAVFALVPLVLSAMLLPVGVGGWGLREGAAAALWPLAGAAPEAGVAASVAYGLVALAATLPGLALLAVPPAAAPRA